MISENAASGRVASSKIDRAQSAYWAPTLRAAWMIVRFSPLVG